MLDVLDTFGDFIQGHPWQALGVVMLGVLAVAIVIAGCERRWGGQVSLEQQRLPDDELPSHELQSH